MATLHGPASSLAWQEDFKIDLFHSPGLNERTRRLEQHGHRSGGEIKLEFIGGSKPILTKKDSLGSHHKLFRMPGSGVRTEEIGSHGTFLRREIARSPL